MKQQIKRSMKKYRNIFYKTVRNHELCVSPMPIQTRIWIEFKYPSNPYRLIPNPTISQAANNFIRLTVVGGK